VIAGASKWDLSLSKAVAKSNASGGRSNLTRTTSRSKAKAPGVVRLSPQYVSVDSSDAYRRTEGDGDLAFRTARRAAACVGTDLRLTWAGSRTGVPMPDRCGRIVGVRHHDIIID